MYPTVSRDLKIQELSKFANISKNTVLVNNSVFTVINFLAHILKDKHSDNQ